MFESREFPKSLDEAIFNAWLENGRSNKLGSRFLLVIWDRYDAGYKPVYVTDRDDIEEYTDGSSSREQLVAVYDLYSESRII